MRFILGITVLFLVACTSAPRDAVTEYKLTARGIGLTPVYPPEEWIQVGDIYIQSVPRTAPGATREDVEDKVQVYFASSPRVVEEAQGFMNNRLVFRLTSLETDENGEDVASQRDTLRGQLRTRNSLDIETLPIVAFPEVEADAGTNFGFNIVRVFQALGIGANTRTRVVLNFNDVRKYGVPKVAVGTIGRQEAYQAYLATTAAGQGFSAAENTDTFHSIVNNAILRELQAEQVRLTTLGTNQTLSTDRCNRFVVITEVYLTRKITYTFTDARIQALALQRLSEEDGDTDPQAGNAPTPIVGTIVINGATGEGQTTPLELTDTDTVRQNVLNGLAGANVGEGLVFDQFTTRGAQFSQTFERPVVIGFDGFDTPFPTPQFRSNPAALESCVLVAE
jgi:hypothetical protein